MKKILNVKKLKKITIQNKKNIKKIKKNKEKN